jgi:DnaJ-class molecular chaperone
MTSPSEEYFLSAADRLALAVAKLRKVAAECADCAGTGIVTHLDVRGTVYDRQDFCEACHDIHDVITRCTA